jgi:hypothetical protein
VQNYRSYNESDTRPEGAEANGSGRRTEALETRFEGTGSAERRPPQWVALLVAKRMAVALWRKSDTLP